MVLNGFCKNKDLEIYLQNKRVIIVGPSAHLTGKNLGTFINQYDIICRLNEIIPIGFENDYGDRTDIAFLNCSTLGMNTIIYKIKESEEIAKKMKFIICPVTKALGSDSLWNNGDGVIANASLINIYNIPFVHIGLDNYKLIFSEYGVECSSGSIAILMLLQYSIKELAIAGISFYSQGNINSPETHSEGYNLYYHKSYPPPPSLMWEVDTIVNPYKSHQVGPQVKYFKEKILTQYSNIIKIDSYLNKMLGVNYHNVF